MRSIMKNMLRRNRNGEKEKKRPEVSDGTVETSKIDSTWNSYMINRHMPVHRRDRKVSTAVFQQLPSLLSVNINEREALFIKKLRVCSYVFDFNDESVMVNEKNLKLQCLLELMEYLTKYKPAFSEAVLQEVMHMIHVNIFRPLPPFSAELGIYDPEEDDPIQEPAWPHLQVVYEFLLRCLLSTETDMKLMKKYINTDFVGKLILTLISEDPREREYIKNIIHRVYRKFMSMRSFIRKSVSHTLTQFIYENTLHPGIPDMLEIYGSVINGFALPLKAEHKVFLKNVLLPLHVPQCLTIYFEPLIYCTILYIEKDPTLTPMFLEGLIKYWPKWSSRKEVMFLMEIDEILDRLSYKVFAQVHIPLCKLLAKSIESLHFQVSEHALSICQREAVLDFLNTSREAVFPIILPAIFRTRNKHWNSSIGELAGTLLKHLEDAEHALFNEIRNDFDAQSFKDLKISKKETRQKKWDYLEKIANEM